jgi:selenoprotein W-related protein
MPNPRIEIRYCRQCQWMLRAAWYAQELLTTFGEEVGEVALVPGTGGIFEVRCGDVLIWDRKAMECFPDIKQLKQLVRDQIAPDKQLGHTDRSKST